MVINIISALMNEEPQVKDERIEQRISKGDRLELKLYRSVMVLGFLFVLILKDTWLFRGAQGWETLTLFIFVAISMVRSLYNCRYGTLRFEDEKGNSGAVYVVSGCLCAGLCTWLIGLLYEWSAWLSVLAGAAACLAAYALFVAAYNRCQSDQKAEDSEPEQ